MGEININPDCNNQRFNLSHRKDPNAHFISPMLQNTEIKSDNTELDTLQNGGIAAGHKSQPSNNVQASVRPALLSPSLQFASEGTYSNQMRQPSLAAHKATTDAIVQMSVCEEAPFTRLDSAEVLSTNQSTLHPAKASASFHMPMGTTKLSNGVICWSLHRKRSSTSESS